MIFIAAGLKILETQVRFGTWSTGWKDAGLSGSGSHALRRMLRSQKRIFPKNTGVEGTPACLQWKKS
jgi:hypothetical protein